MRASTCACVAPSKTPRLLPLPIYRDASREAAAGVSCYSPLAACGRCTPCLVALLLMPLLCLQAAARPCTGPCSETTCPCWTSC